MTGIKHTFNEPPTSKITRHEIELSHAWMTANPALAVRSILDFMKINREDGFSVTADISREGFTTFIADAPKANQISDEVLRAAAEHSGVSFEKLKGIAS